MQKQISPAVAAGIVVVLLLVLGIAIWHSFAGPPEVDPHQIPAGFPGSKAVVSTAPGQLPPGAGIPKGAPGTR